MNNTIRGTNAATLAWIAASLTSEGVVFDAVLNEDQSWVITIKGY